MDLFNNRVFEMAKSEDRVGHVYDFVRKKAENFEFKPESQINEVALAKELGTSRTPVREALNRLVAEGFLTFQARRGFFCRPLSPAQIQALYEARVAVETEAVRLAIGKLSDDELDILIRDLRAIEPEYQTCKDPARLLELDEQFHMAIAKAAKNPELERILANLNGRIRLVRLIDLKTMGERESPKPDAGHISAHQGILTHIAERDEAAATLAIRKHIERRREQTTEAVAKAFAAIFYNDDMA